MPDLPPLTVIAEYWSAFHVIFAPINVKFVKLLKVKNEASENVNVGSLVKSKVASLASTFKVLVPSLPSIVLIPKIPSITKKSFLSVPVTSVTPFKLEDRDTPLLSFNITSSCLLALNVNLLAIKPVVVISKLAVASFAAKV